MSELPNDDRTVSLPISAGGSNSSTPDAPSRDGLPVGTRVAEFEIRGVIGEGGFSIVYLAWDSSLHRNVALKEYVPEFASRDSSLRVAPRSQRQREMFDVGLKSFVGEARMLAGFDHPSLVKVHRFWEDFGTAFMVMPWYQGPTLKQALRSDPQPPSEAWLLELLRPLIDALSVLHSQRCYHRDIAPDNIILAGDARVPVLLDLGAARKVIESLTHDLTTILKTGYAPIEQYGEIPGMRQGPWTDVYALAAVVHFAIRGITPPAAVVRVVNDTYEPLVGLGLKRYSKTFLTAIDKALAVRPQDRTQTIAEFRAQLMLEPSPSEESSPPAVSRRVLVPVGVFCVALAALAIGGVLVWRSERPATASGQIAPAAPTTPASALPATRPSAPEPDKADAEAKRREMRESSQRLANVVADLRQLAEAEKQDIAPLLRTLDQRQASAATAANAGAIDTAIAENFEATSLAQRELKKTVSELVRRYSALAEKATAAKQFDIAQQALDRAKAVAAIGAKYQ
jgi:serine/threonine protein kinase